MPPSTPPLLPLLLLPLLLFAGSLAPGAAQMTTSPPLTQLVDPSTVTTPSGFNDVMAVFQAVVLSSRELDETTVSLFLNQYATAFQVLNPQVQFSFIVRNVTRV